MEILGYIASAGFYIFLALIIVSGVVGCAAPTDSRVEGQCADIFYRSLALLIICFLTAVVANAVP